MASLRVLLVEPMTLVRSGFACLLEKAPGITVVGEAATAEEALRLAQERAPEVLLLSVRGLELPGAEVVRRLREEGARARVLMLLERAEQRPVLQMLEHGAAGFLTKQEEPQVLFEAVRRVREREEAWFSPRIARRLAPAQVRKQTLLSRREQEVLERAALGQPNEQIAEALGVGTGTVRNHLSSIYSKLGVRSRAEAMAWAWQNGLVRPE